jgi:pyrroloquinoline quinone biosynthesis protein B
VIVRVLGSAAGGGVPQWNCACVNCKAAREGRAPRRTQSSLAVSPSGDAHWILLNCSPDVAGQIESFAPLQPRAGRDTPIDGVLLTDANFDHIGGLPVLRQSSRCTRVRSSAAVRAIAATQPSFAQFDAPPHRWLEVPLGSDCPNDGDDDIAGALLAIRALSVPGTTPGYDGRRTVCGAVVAYEVTGHNGRRLLFAPVFSAISSELADAIARSDVAFLDGSFYSDDEMIAAKLSSRSARQMGHQPVGGPGGTLERLGGALARVVFTHLNNSNPMLDPNSAAYATVRTAGAEIAYDGMELTL